MEKEQKVVVAKMAKLKGKKPKTEPKPTKDTGQAQSTMDLNPNSEDMPQLISDDDDNTDPTKTGTKKKKLVTKKPTDKKLHK